MDFPGPDDRTAWCTGLLDLLAERHQFPLTTHHHLLVERLLDRVGPGATHAELKHVLAPVLARSADEQRAFHAVFDAYTGAPGTPGAPPLPRDPDGTAASLPGPRPSAPPGPVSRARALRRVAIAVGVGAAVFVFGPGPYSHPPTVDTPATGPAPIDATALDPASPPVQPATEWPEARLFLPPRLPVEPTWYARHAEDVARGLALFALAAALAHDQRRRRRDRRAVTRGRVPGPPWVWPVMPAHPGAEPFAGPDVLRVARAMHRRGRGPAHEFHVERSVAATVAATGFPTFRFEPRSRSPEYLVLVERRSARDHLAAYHEALVRRLSDAGPYVALYFYDHDPRVCVAPGGRCLHLDELLALHPDPRLVVVGSGTGMLHPSHPRPAAWTGMLDDWPERTVLRTGGPGLAALETALRPAFEVLPATLKGWERMPQRGWEAERAGRQPPLPPAAAAPPASAADPAALREALGDPVFRWLCACAVYPLLHWELTLALTTVDGIGREVLAEDHATRLFALPWFREGIMPNAVRRDLLDALEEMDAADGRQTELAVRTLLARVLEVSDVPGDSMAGQLRDRERLLQQIYLQRRDPSRNRGLLRRLRDTTPDVELLRDVTVVRLLRKVRPSRLSVILPAPVRNRVYRAGVPGFGPSRGATAVMGAGVAMGLWAGTPRPPVDDGSRLVALTEAVVGRGGPLLAVVLDSAGRAIDETVTWESAEPDLLRTGDDGTTWVAARSGVDSVVASARGHRATVAVRGAGGRFNVIHTAPLTMDFGDTVRVPWRAFSGAEPRAAGACVRLGAAAPPVAFAGAGVLVAQQENATTTLWAVRGGDLEITTLHVASGRGGVIRELEEPLLRSAAAATNDSVFVPTPEEEAALRRKAALLRADPLRYLHVTLVRTLSGPTRSVDLRPIEAVFADEGVESRVSVVATAEMCTSEFLVDVVRPPRIEFLVSDGIFGALASLLDAAFTDVNLIEGDTTTLQLPPSIDDRSAIRWTSGDPTIASVTPDGRVRALRQGTTDLVARTARVPQRGATEGQVATSVSITVQPRPPISTGYAGTRRDSDGAVYQFAMRLDARGRAYSGFINWTLVNGGRRPGLRGLVGRTATEFMRGTYDPAADTLRLRGDSVVGGDIVAPGRYHLGFSLTRDTASGRGTGVDGSGGGRIEARGANPPAASAMAIPAAGSCSLASSPMLVQAGADDPLMLLRSGEGGTLLIEVAGRVAGPIRIASSDSGVARVASQVDPPHSGTVVSVDVGAGRAGNAVLTVACGASTARVRVSVQPRPNPTIEVDTTGLAERERFVALANEHRSRVGCPALQWDDRAMFVAQTHAEAMQAQQRVANQLPGEDSLSARLRAVGLTPRESAQHVISGAFNANDVLLAWLDRASSRANLETCAFTHHGVGRAEPMWTHVLYGDGVPRDTLERRPPER